MLKKQYTKESLINDITLVSKKINKSPTAREYIANGNTSLETIQRYFGSWNKALEASGLSIRQPNNKGTENGQRVKLTLAIRWYVLNRDKFMCQYCGRTPKDGATLQVDHIISIANGGTNDFNNLISSCWECNVGKGTRF
jgi:hypothetical protein